MKKRFSLRYKLILIFGLLIAFNSAIQAILAVRIARKAVTEKVEAHLTDKATDVAAVLDGRINAFLEFLEGIARMPMLQDASLPFAEKSRRLMPEAALNTYIEYFGVCDVHGNRYAADGSITALADRSWFKAAVQGKKAISEPLLSRVTGKLQIIVAVPIYDARKNIISVLNAGVDGLWLSDQIKDIVVGNTGTGYILGFTGTIIADKDIELVKNRVNFNEEAKKNPAFNSLAAFEKMAIEVDVSSVGYYHYENMDKIASYATMKTTGWTVIIYAPVHEFMGTVDELQLKMLIIGTGILISALIVVFLVARTMVKPIQTAVSALQNIAQGEGDLTIQLPLIGNDEITEMSEYFNETIAKIGTSIQQVDANTTMMEKIGNELASNMTETAGAVNEISANIDQVKQQAFTQAACVTKTAAAIEEIVRTIKQLNASVETQAASIAQSSSSVDQMVANIVIMGQTLEKTDEIIKSLTAATGDGKATLGTSNTITQKVAEESGSLMEASSVIQHIASQTNLLAMNAAIEAAHAGAAGKGFAVVADEIRKLAEESSAQGKTITTTLKMLSSEIETLSSSSKVTEDKFNAIFNLAEQVKEMSLCLTESMSKQENGSKEVLSAIKNINMVTMEVQEGSEEMLKGGEGVAEEMQKLDSLTRVITESMNEMASGAVQINNAVHEVNEITQKNKQSIESLSAEVGKFKV
ncbi:MAG: methyl-accepting chemotaxis protein [Treponema sp.]